VTINGHFLDFHTVGGSSLAGPMWAKAMQVIQDYLPSVPFDKAPKGKPTGVRKPTKSTSNNDDNGGGDNNGGGGNGRGGGGRGRG
jgi:membrane peptidoglycan carboxypeptidase